jgi:malate permease and related proteins
MIEQLFPLYAKLISGVILGWYLGKNLPSKIPEKIGKALFWVGIPISIIAFLRGSELTGTIWIAPLIAWLAMLLSIVASFIFIKSQKIELEKYSQGSFLLSSMIGNTGYLGYPITLAVAGEKYFAYALFYDILGSMLGAYSLGVFLAAYFGKEGESKAKLILAMFQNPTLWALFFGLYFRNYPLPELLDQSLKNFSWGMIAVALMLIGMRLSQIKSWSKIKLSSASLTIKMLIIPLILGLIIGVIGITDKPQLVIILQMAMPPAFATLVIAEAFNLDRELTVTSLALGSILILLILPLWLLLFAS